MQTANGKGKGNHWVVAVCMCAMYGSSCVVIIILLLLDDLQNNLTNSEK